MAVQKYRAKISGPLLDRVDIHLDVPPVAYDDLVARTPADLDGAAEVGPGQVAEAIQYRVLDRGTG
jgi:predicted ATPase with chaperone activity